MSDQQPPPERPANPYDPDASDPPTQSFAPLPPPPNPYGTGPADQAPEQPARQAPQAPPAAADPPPSPYGTPSATPAAPGPDPYGAAPEAPAVNPYGAPPPAYGGYAPAAYGAGPTRDPDKRPGTVTAAAVITLVLSVLTALGVAAGLIGLVVARDDLVGELRNEPELSSVDADAILTIGVVVLAVPLIWCLAAVVISVLVLRRSQVARILLVVSSAFTLLLSLLAILSVVSAVTLIAAIAVIVLLFTGGAKEWFAGRSGSQPPTGRVGA